MDDDFDVRLKRLLDEKLRPHAERVVKKINNEFDFLPAALYQSELSSRELSARIIASDQVLTKQTASDQRAHQSRQEELTAQIEKMQKRLATLNYLSLGLTLVTLILVVVILVKR